MGEFLTLAGRAHISLTVDFCLSIKHTPQPNPIFGFLSFHCVRASYTSGQWYFCFFLLSGRSHQSRHSSCQGFLPFLHSCIRMVNIWIYLTKTSIYLTVNQQLMLVFRSSDLFSDQIAPGIIWAHFQSITVVVPQFQKILESNKLIIFPLISFPDLFSSLDLLMSTLPIHLCIPYSWFLSL